MSGEMKKLRKEISLCESIAERSELLEPKLEQIHKEEVEEKSLRSHKRAIE